MSRISNLSPNDIISLISENEITVIEDVQGSKIFINFNNGEVKLRAKTISSNDINLIDLAMQQFYNKAIIYANTLPERIQNMLNKNWWFGFEYFPDNQPANIEYEKLPLNNLVLTSIYKNNKFDYTIDELIEYANLLQVETIPVIFHGKLDSTSLEGIQYFLNTSPEDLEYIFGEKSFAYFFYKLLNPSSSSSFLMRDDFQKNVQRIIIRVNSEDINFTILNPLYNSMSETKVGIHTDIYTRILLNFLVFCQTINIDKLKLEGTNKDIVYLNIICRLFNTHIKDSYDDLIQMEFDIPVFFKNDKFKVNKSLITNKTTLKYIDNPKIEYIFKCILSSFYKKKSNIIGVFDESTLEIFNNFVDKLNTLILSYLGIQRERKVRDNTLLSFSDYFDIKYDSDANGNIYIIPDMYDELGIVSDKKKKIVKK